MFIRASRESPELSTSFRQKTFFILAVTLSAFTLLSSALLLRSDTLVSSHRIGSKPDTVTIAGNVQGLFLSLDAGTASRIISPTVRIDAIGNTTNEVGCGFLISSNGLVISSWHIVAAAQNIIVSLASGENYQGQVIRYDSERDLALIKLQTNRTDLPALSLAAGTDIFTGMTVMKVSFYPDAKVSEPGITAGVVTATPDIGGRGYIQTDAPEKASAGEPLVNCQGIVVGICLGPTTDSGTSSVGLAISAVDCLAFLNASNIEY